MIEKAVENFFNPLEGMLMASKTVFFGPKKRFSLEFLLKNPMKSDENMKNDH